jgi:hypothetical protein
VIAINVDVLPGLAVLAVLGLWVLWVRRPRRGPLPVVRYEPRAHTERVYIETRTREQREADQARVNELGFPRRGGVGRGDR